MEVRELSRRYEAGERDFSGADLHLANLSGVDLREADLRKAKVTDEQLAQAKFLKGTTLPDGTKHD